MREYALTAGRRLLALALCLVMLLSLLPASVFAVDGGTVEPADENVIYLLAGSDYQSNAGQTPEANMPPILEQINDTYTRFDGLLFCGDYTVKYNEPNETLSGINAIKNHLTTKGITIDPNNMVFVQGNHDPRGGEYTAASGGHDPEGGGYGVFVINENDYRENPDRDGEGKTATVAIAEQLKTYLSQKTDPSEPIFVIAHVPLHYCDRSYNNSDGHYAKYLVDVMNEAAERGLTIFYLYGHNHTQGHDSYLGGSVNLLAPGDTIYLADPEGSKTDKPSACELKFTYMNAGYVGNFSGSASTVASALTMSVFEIHRDYVAVKKYDANGLFNLRVPGAYADSSADRLALDRSLGVTPSNTTYTSPKNISLSPVALDNAYGGVLPLRSSKPISATAASGYTLSYSSSDTRVATVSSDGTGATVTAVGGGTATITVTAAPSTERTGTTASVQFDVTVPDENAVVLLEQGTIYKRQPASWDGGFPYTNNYDGFKALVDGNQSFLIAAENGGYADGAGERKIMSIGKDPNSREIISQTVQAYDLCDGGRYIKESDVDPGSLWQLTDKTTGPTDDTYDYFSIINTSLGEGDTRYVIADDKEESYAARGLRVATDKSKGETFARWRMTSNRGLESQSGRLYPADGGRFIYYSGSGTGYFATSDYDGYTDANGVVQVAANTRGGRRVYLYYPLTIPEKITAQLSSDTGTVRAGAADSEETGTRIMMIQGDTLTEIPVTVDMLSGVDTSVPGIHRGLTVTYLGKDIATDYTLLVGVSQAENGALVLVEAGSTIYKRQPASWDGGKPYTNKNDGFETLYDENKSFLIVAENGGYVDGAGERKIVSIGTDPSSREIISQTVQAWSLYDGSLYIYGSDVDAGSLWQFDTLHIDESDGYDYFYIVNTSLGEGNTRYLAADDQDTEWASRGFRVSTSNSLERSFIRWRMTSNRGLESLSGRKYENDGGRFIYYDENGYFATSDYDGYTASDGTVVTADKKDGRRVYLYYPEVAANDITVHVDRGGIIRQDANNKAGTGSYVVITDGDTVTRIPVTLDMVSGTYNKMEQGTYAGLTVTWNGMIVTTDYSLTVCDSEYPEYPLEGAVRVSKSGTAVDQFQKTGVANMGLTTTGIPLHKGIDVMIVLDMSGSMRQCVAHQALKEKHGTGDIPAWDETTCKTRVDALKDALSSMLRILKQPSSDGSPADIDVAISQFNTFTYFSDVNCLTDGSVSVVSGTDNGVIQPFTDINSLSFDPYTANWSVLTGTNYDVALQDAYVTLAAKKAKNEENGEEREQIVIFMSDGLAVQYNYLASGTGDARWNNWLQGTMNDSGMPEIAKTYFYHPDGKHWMAEAIKGAPDQTYWVIWNDAREPNACAFDANTNIKQMPGLGAKIYTIGFLLSDQDSLKRESGVASLKAIATDETYYREANNAAELDTVFQVVASNVTYAGENAYFLDTMGPAYDLNYLQTRTTGNGEPVTLPATPKIEYKEYILYTRSDIGKTINGVTVTEDMVGQRTGEERVLETVTFTVDGNGLTGAHSTQVDNGTTNILKDGVIEARYFYYNASSATATRSVFGKDVQIAPETFCCLVGRISETERCLSYQVYLTGSMEGTRNEGTYDTNQSATLYYTNYLGNNCHKDTVSPVFPWGSAVVNYAFYLVDEAGKPVVNSITGATGSFAESVKLTRPVSQEILLNASGAYDSVQLFGSANLPDGYTLFDENASYTIKVDSSGGGEWVVGVGENVGALTTYVADYGGNPTTKTNSHNETGVDYTRTTVWFAVLYEIKAIPDTVVIDFALPVDIHVLGNDIGFAQNATLEYVGSLSSFEIGNDQKPWEYLQKLAVEQTAKFATTEVTGSFGKAEVKNDKLRYTLGADNGMQMSKEETFVYAVDYTGDYGANGYYYSTVTVIPATTIYYEDSFVTFKTFDYKTATEKTSTWVVDGTAQDAVQAEDRPGQGLSGIDANNLYGYDAAYGDMQTYSLGTAHKVKVWGITNEKKQVTAGEYATAEFTFNGTGFDVISLTSNRTGTITVEVLNENGENAGFYLVDTYYGYKYDDTTKEWVVDPNATNALYQVPVIKVENLPYGKYTARITASYAALFDHGQYETGNSGERSYDFYLDAIRIYDPANDGQGNQTIEDAYKADYEGWPKYFELRNLIIEKGSFATDKSVPGIVFIDNTGANKTPTIEDYKNFGPNNELYLAAGQAIAFDLDATGDVASVQIAMKTAGSGSASVSVYAAGETAQAAQTISTATDMYYDITKLNGKTVIIANTSDTANKVILSITNVKVTYKTKPVEAQPAECFSISPASAQAAVQSLRSLYHVVFAPERLDVKLAKEYVRLGEKVYATITTEDDVDHLVVNGVKVTAFTADRRTGTRTWKVKFTAKELGQIPLTVVAYDADALASDPVTVTVTVFKLTLGTSGQSSGTPGEIREMPLG